MPSALYRAADRALSVLADVNGSYITAAHAKRDPVATGDMRRRSLEAQGALFEAVHPIRVRRVRVQQADRNERLRWVWRYQVVTVNGEKVGHPQQTAALARSSLTRDEETHARMTRRD